MRKGPQNFCLVRPLSDLVILMHGKIGLAEKIAGRPLGSLAFSLIEGDNGFAAADIADGIVDSLGIIARVGDKGALLDGGDLVGGIKNIERDTSKETGGSSIHRTE